jgi:hypothetical protein
MDILSVCVASGWAARDFQFFLGPKDQEKMLYIGCRAAKETIFFATNSVAKKC